MHVFHVPHCVVRWCHFWWVIISTVSIQLAYMFSSNTFADGRLRLSIGHQMPDIDHRIVAPNTQHLGLALSPHSKIDVHTQEPLEAT